MTAHRLLSPAQRRAQVAAAFDRVADTYDDVGVPWFTPIARRLVAEVAPRPGDRALDIGCGRGAALFALASAVGPGAVTGIDVSPRMVAATRADADARGLSGVELHVMDAGAPELPAASFDVAVASFVLFFLPAPLAALRAWRALLAPGGRLALSTFADRGAGWLDDVFRPYLPDAAFASTPYASEGGVADLVRRAGFVHVRTVTFELDVAFDDVDHWRRWSWSHGQRATWERIPAEHHPRVVAAAAEWLAGHRAADGRITLTERIDLTLAETVPAPPADDSVVAVRR